MTIGTTFTIPFVLTDALMSRFGEAILERREVMGYAKQGDLADASKRLEREDPATFAKFSQQWLSRLENDKDGDIIESARTKQLRTLAYLLEWGQYDFERRVGINIGRVPRLDDDMKGTIFDESPKVGRRLDEGMLVRHGGTVSAGLSNIVSATDDVLWVEIPRNIARNYNREDLFVLDVEGDSMLAEDVKIRIPPGASVVFHKTLEPKPGQTIVCWLERRDMGVLKVARKEESHTVLYSHNNEHEPIIVNKDNPAIWQGTVVGWWVPDPFANGNWAD
jgi:phage repressor protein C with HTH and peptisase S24 domain